MAELQSYGFPFLFGGTFIEGFGLLTNEQAGVIFPFLFGGTFIEGRSGQGGGSGETHFPSFSEGLSLRARSIRRRTAAKPISLPFRRDFH